MKKVIAILVILAMASLALALDLPKDPDRVDYQMDTPSRIVISGELTLASPTWLRWRPASYDELGLNCDLVMATSYTTQPHYDLYCFNVTTSDPVEFVVDEAGFDTVIYIYCDPFDPNQPTENAVYMDDDDGEGLLSAITAANGVTLTPGLDYWFIICSYSSTVGTYSVSTSDNVALCGGVANEGRSWSNLKGLF
ncbi:MAG: hypothetical protein R3D98_01305 [Candidatus Krumholzibacteriia bacterium]